MAIKELYGKLKRIPGKQERYRGGGGVLSKWSFYRGLTIRDKQIQRPSKQRKRSMETVQGNGVYISRRNYQPIKNACHYGRLRNGGRVLKVED